MKNLILTIGILVLLASLCFAVWDNDIPGDNRTWNLAAGDIRDNWDALETILGVDLDITGITWEVTSLVSDDLTTDDIVTKSPWHDVRAYGAVEDGATDNTAFIQAAIDAAEQDAVINKARGVVMFPTVTGLGYKCDSDIQLKDQIIITGGGMIEFSGTYGFESNEKEGWVIDGITILGSTTTGQIGVYIHNSSVKWWIRNCQFYDIEIGIFGTRTYIGRIINNDMYLIGTVDTTCIKLTSGEGNCSKGTEYNTVKGIEIHGNMLKEFGDPTSAEPLIWLGDSALAPVDPTETHHISTIDISRNELTCKYGENAIRLENTINVTIEKNWIEGAVKAAVYLAGQWNNSTVIRANGFWGNNNDDNFDPAIKVESTTVWDTFNLRIADNEFNRIHSNHNYLEIDNVIGLVIDNNLRLDPARVVLTTCTAVDIRQPEWNYIFDTFADADATPSVKFRTLFNTFTNVLTITAFDDPIVGQEIKIISKAAITFDTTTANDATHNLDGSSVDITTADGDITTWLYNGTSWTLLSWIDISLNNSSNATGLYGQ